MIKLFKYEFQRKWKMALGVLLMYFVIYAGFLLKFKADGTVSFEEMGFSIVFFILLGGALVFAAIIGAINSLRLEAKHATRDLYFSIPINSYKKIGSKVIVSVLEVGLAGIIALVSATKAMEVLSNFDVLKMIIDQAFELPTSTLIYLALFQLVQGILSLLIIYLSFAIFRSFFSQVKFGGFVTIVIYIILNVILAYITYYTGNGLDGAVSGDLAIWSILGVFTLLTAGVFILIGYLFENKVSFD